MVVLGQELLYSGKSGCNRKGCCMRAKLLYSGKNGCVLAKVVVFGQKRLYS